VAVTVAEPAATPVTNPLVLTVAIAGLLELQVTVRAGKTLPFASFVTAESCCVGVMLNTRVVVAGVTVTVATGIGSTAMLGVVAAGAVSLVAVIVAVPIPTAVTVIVAPVDVLTEDGALTESTAGLLEIQFTARPERAFPFASLGAAVST
jgi:hypothetical protein